MRLRGAGASLAVVAVLLLGGCGGGSGETGAVPAGSSQTGAGEPAPAGTASGGPGGEAAGGSAGGAAGGAGGAAAAVTTAPGPVRTTESAAQRAAQARRAADKVKADTRKVQKKLTFTMPSLVGRNLQAAQDTLQSRGSYLLDEQDASGQLRHQVLDRDWKVCSQSPKPGTKHVSILTVVKLASVKLGESCPS